MKDSTFSRLASLSNSTCIGDLKQPPASQMMLRTVQHRKPEARWSKPNADRNAHIPGICQFDL